VGVGLMEGRNGVNWKHLAKTFTSWVFTLIFVGLFSAALFSQGAYAPSVQGNREVQALAKTINKLSASKCIEIFGKASGKTTCNI
jgi:sodium-dependent phosphate transporter